MKKILEKTAVIAFAAVLAFSTALTAFADNEGSDVPAVETEDTPVPEISDEPVISEEPVPTEEPVLTDTPTPEPTIAEDTPTPKPTDKPTNTPKPTKKPSNTPTPTDTETPTPTEPEDSPTPTDFPYDTVVPPSTENDIPAPKAKSDKKAEIKSHSIIKIDGIIEELWNETDEYPIRNVSWGESGASGSFKVYWDKSELYILVTVKDDTPDTLAEKFSRKDCVEIFINEKGTRPEAYSEGDLHFKISRSSEVEYGNGANEEKFHYAVVDSEDGYMIEIGVPFSTISPFYGAYLGFDVRINDSQNDQYRDYMTQWSDTSMYTYTDLSKIGMLYLK